MNEMSLVLSVALITSGVLLIVGFIASWRGRRRACAGSVTLGLIASGLAIYLGFSDIGPSTGTGGGLAPVVYGKLAVGLGLLLFAVGWVTLLSPRRGPTVFGFGFNRNRTRRTTRPELPVVPPVHDPRSPHSRRMTRPDLGAIEPRPPHSRRTTRPSMATVETARSKG